MDKAFGIKLFVVVLLAVVVLGASFLAAFLRYQGDALAQASALRPLVYITTPNSGDQLRVDEHVSVEVQAVGGQGFALIDLWIADEKLGSQPIEWGSEAGVTAAFAWEPRSPGAYLIVGQATDNDGIKTTSPGVTVLVTQSEFAGEVEDVSVGFSAGPEVVPAAQGGEGGPGFPGDSAPGGAPWSADPIDWIEAQTTSDPPTTPGLAVEVEDCVVNLAIQDQADNESGFFVYRQAVQDPIAMQLAALDEHQGVGWLKYEDQPGPGTFLYYASAFNDQGSADSNPISAEVDPESCFAEEEASAETLQLEFTNVQLGDDVTQAYCYRSLNGLQWDRWPMSGFFEPQEGGFLPEGDTWEVLLGGEGEEVDETQLSLSLQCWGWENGELEMIGEMERELGDGGTGPLVIQTDRVSFDLTPAMVLDEPVFIPLNEDLSTIDLDPAEFGDTWETLKLSMQMPMPYAFAVQRAGACEEHLPPEMQNLAGKILFCTPWPGYTLDEGTENPQRYLVWVVSEECGAGYGYPPCTSYEEWLQEADKVGFTVTYSTDLVSNYQITFDVPYFTVYVVKPLACESFRSFRVQMWARIDDKTVYGWPSPVETIPCEKPNQGLATVYVNFDKMTFPFVEDGEDEPQDLEIYGKFKAWTSVDEVELWHGRQSDWPSECPSEAFNPTLDASGTLGATEGLGCRRTVSAGIYQYELANSRMCAAPCSENFYAPNRNEVALTVPDGEPIYLMVSLMDYDSASANDTVCYYTWSTHAHTYDEWMNLEDETLWIGGTSSFENGDCRMLVELNGALAPLDE